MPTTKLYENATDQTIVLRELGNHELKGGDRVSITTEFQTPINLLNYPGIAEVSELTAEEHEAALTAAREAYKERGGKAAYAPAPPAPVEDQPPADDQSGLTGDLQVDKQEGK